MLFVSSWGITNCITGVLYATTLHNNKSKAILELALATFYQSVEEAKPSLLYRWYYEQKETSTSSLDMSFDDQMLDGVEERWKEVIGDNEELQFMQFEERNGMNADDDDNEDY